MRLIGLVLASAVLVACGGGSGGGGGGGPTGPGPGPAPSTRTVTMGAATFSPNATTLALNGTVTWVNSSGIEHNVTFAAAAGAPASIDNHTSGSTARTFGTAGTFSYTCTNHAGMTGSVAVQ